MVSVRRIAIAVGSVVAAFALAVLAVAPYEHYREHGINWYTDEPLKPVVAILVVMAIVPRWRRHLGVATAIATAALLLALVHVLGAFSPRATQELFDVLAAVFLMAALAAFTRGRLPLAAPLAVVTTMVLAIAIPLLVLLFMMPFGDAWNPPTWNDGHLHPLRAPELCRGVTLFDARHGLPYVSVGILTSNFRGEHRPMVFLRGEFRDGNEWVPPDALASMLVDDRDPALHPCEGAGRHPIWPRSSEPVHDRLRY